jgi:hypothetical protein
VGRIRLCSDTLEVHRDGQPIALGLRAYDTLKHLSRNSGRVVSKAELLNGLAVEEGTLSAQNSARRWGPRPSRPYPASVTSWRAAWQNRCPRLSDKPSLVVRPFVNLSHSAENDGLMHRLITAIIVRLSRLSGRFLIAATTRFRFKGEAVDLAALGTRLDDDGPHGLV